MKVRKRAESCGFVMQIGSATECTMGNAATDVGVPRLSRVEWSVKFGSSDSPNPIELFDQQPRLFFSPTSNFPANWS